MWDENTTVSKREGHPYFDWPSDGSCHRQALSQLNTKLAEQLAGTAYSLQLTICIVQCTAQFPSIVFVSNHPCYMGGLASPDHCQSWPAAGGTHRGPQSGGERKYKEGRSDRSNRGDTDIFSHWFDCKQLSGYGSFFRFESPAPTPAPTPVHSPQVCMYLWKNWHNVQTSMKIRSIQAV